MVAGPAHRWWDRPGMSWISIVSPENDQFSLDHSSGPPFLRKPQAVIPIPVGEILIMG